MKTVYVILFFVLIITPFTLLIADIHIPKTYIRENRVLAKKPDILEVPFARLAQAFENYFNDNLPLRTHFLASYMKIWEMRFSSFVRENVKGKDGHYFFNSNDGPTVERYLGLKDLSKEQLYRFRTVVAGRQAFWKTMGADYLFCLVPDKVSLYPELLPDWINEHHGWYDQLNQVLENTAINYMDGKKVLEKQKDPEKPFFNKVFDIAHWNGNALGTMFDVIAEKMIQIEGFQPIDEKEKAYTIVMRDVFAAPYTYESVPWMELNTEGLHVVKNDYGRNKTAPWEGCDIVINDRAERGTLLFAVDSYFKTTHQDRILGAYGKIFPLAHTVHKFISTHYKERFSVIQEIAKREKPDMVVEISVERAGVNITTTRFPRLLIAGEMLLNQAGLIITPELPTQYGKNKNCTLTLEPGGLKVRAETNDPILKLPAQKTNKDGRFVVMVKLHSPVASRAQVFWAHGRMPFKEERGIVRQTKKGINYLHFPIYAKPDEKIKLRFDPGIKKEIYTILPMPDLKNIFSEEI